MILYCDKFSILLLLIYDFYDVASEYDQSGEVG